VALYSPTEKSGDVGSKEILEAPAREAEANAATVKCGISSMEDYFVCTAIAESSAMA
jgi:hypothetical protein